MVCRRKVSWPIGLGLAACGLATAARVAVRHDNGLGKVGEQLLELRARPATQPVMLGWHEKVNDVDGLRTKERRLGARFAIVRYYSPWRMPSSRVQDFVTEVQLVVSSHRPPATGWGRVASGAEDQLIAARSTDTARTGTRRSSCSTTNPTTRRPT